MITIKALSPEDLKRYNKAVQNDEIKLASGEHHYLEAWLRQEQERKKVENLKNFCEADAV